MEEGKRSRRRTARRKNSEGMSIKNALYIAGIILTLGIIAFVITVIAYNNSLDKVYEGFENKKLGEVSKLDTETVANADEEQIEITSSNIR